MYYSSKSSTSGDNYTQILCELLRKKNSINSMFEFYLIQFKGNLCIFMQHKVQIFVYKHWE